MRPFALALIVLTGIGAAAWLDESTIIMGFDVSRPEPIITKGVSYSSADIGASRGCPRFVYGMVLTAAQWQACFDSKQDRVDLAGAERR
jgi:hypothetical protein